MKYTATEFQSDLNNEIKLYKSLIHCINRNCSANATIEIMEALNHYISGASAIREKLIEN